VDEFSYVRLFADDSGESRFEDVVVTLEVREFAPPMSPVHRAGLGDAESVAVIAGGTEVQGSMLHPAPARQFLFKLSGTSRITTSTGDTRVFEPGSTLLVEDTWGKGHSTELLDDGVTVVVRLRS
jgi:hypothetical protein